MKKKVLEYIKRYGMIHPGERVCAGFSGGADSVCLLALLEELSGELGFFLEAVHVNHNLRGAESDGDQAFAEEFCRERGISLHLYSFPVAETSKEKGWGLEETGRYFRQRAFRECMEAYGADRIALAHHRNDAAETLLFHLARGTSLAGMAGIRPVRDRIIRPLLCVSREEILEELKRRGLPWRTDSTNLRDEYTRNCIRHQVIPVLEREVNPRTVEHMWAAGEDLLEAEAFLRGETEKRERRFCRREGNSWLVGEGLAEEPSYLVRRVIHSVLGRAEGGTRDLGRAHLEAVEKLLRAGTGKKVSLPGGLTAVRTYEGIRIGFSDPGEESLPFLGELPVTGPGTYRLGGVTADCRLCGPEEKIPEKTYTKWLDYDRISNGLVLRTRRPGDYLVVNRSGGRKKLKDYMIDEKIPRGERDRILLLASGREVFWVIGGRISESCKVTEKTTRVLRIQIMGGYTDGYERTGSDR